MLFTHRTQQQLCDHARLNNTVLTLSAEAPRHFCLKSRAALLAAMPMLGACLESAFELNNFWFRRECAKMKYPLRMTIEQTMSAMLMIFGDVCLSASSAAVRMSSAFCSVGLLISERLLDARMVKFLSKSVRFN